MSRAHAFFLTLLIWALFVSAVPLCYALWQLLLPKLHELGLWWYSGLMASVAAPFWYLMLRRMR